MLNLNNVLEFQKAFLQQLVREETNVCHCMELGRFSVKTRMAHNHNVRSDICSKDVIVLIITLTNIMCYKMCCLVQLDKTSGIYIYITTKFGVLTATIRLVLICGKTKKYM